MAKSLNPGTNSDFIHICTFFVFPFLCLFPQSWYEACSPILIDCILALRLSSGGVEVDLCSQLLDFFDKVNAFSLVAGAEGGLELLL